MNLKRILGWPLYAAVLSGLTSCVGGPNGTPPISSVQTSSARYIAPQYTRSGCRVHGCMTGWRSFGYDLQRTGYNPLEATVGTNNVGTLQAVWTANVGSEMVHEPVYANGVVINGVPTNVLYAGSAGGRTIYAINAATGSIIWQHRVAVSYYSCGGGQSQFSIGETPAIDPGKNLIYVADGRNEVHAYNLATGMQRQGWPLRIADYQGDHNFMHGGLTYNRANGLLYAVTGSTCDISPWYGRIVAIDTTGPSVTGKFFTMSGNSHQGTSGGGIWGPGGASIEPATNDVFVATGNADTKQQKQNAGYGEQIIELSPNLGTILANNYPPEIPSIPGYGDFDFGATPLLFQPSGCPPLLAAVNKSGIFVLYDRRSISNGPVQAIAMSIPTDSADFTGVPAFDPVTGYVYVGLPTTEGIYRPGMAAFAMASKCTLNPTPVWSQAFGPEGSQAYDTKRSPISIANGVVYISNDAGDTEYAFDASTGAQLWTTSLSGSGDIGTVIANGMVYVSALDGTITAWAPSASAARLRKHVAPANRPTASDSRSNATRELGYASERN